MEAALRTTHRATNVEWFISQSYSLKDALAYAQTMRGGAFRESLCTAVGQVCGIDDTAAGALAQSIEYFHHASLIFDDLPCMDDASERRGRACLHTLMGEDKAILAALALVNRAYTGCWRVASRYPHRCAAAARLVGRCIGELGILDGQDRDLHFESSFGAAEVRSIAIKKTGTLLRLSLLLPAVLGGISTGEYMRLYRLGNYWGRAYQAMDDFGDLLIGAESTDKTPLRDVEKSRPNLVVATGVEAAAEELAGLMSDAARQVESLKGNHSRWAALDVFHAILAEKYQAMVARIERTRS